MSEEIIFSDLKLLSLKNFILKSWVKCFSFSPEFSFWKHGEQSRLMNDAIKKLVSKKSVKVRFIEEQGLVISFIVYEVRMEVFILHFVYTKREFRKQGHAKKLLFEACEKRKHIVTSTLSTTFLYFFKRLKMGKFTHSPSLKHI